MLEFYRCTECGKETDNVFVVTGKRVSEAGTLSVEKGKFCLECLEKWVSWQRRRVSSETIVRYYHSEIGEVGYEKIHEENGELCIKPEMWERLKGD